MYGPGTLEILTFVRQARRLGFRLREIQEIVAIRRSGRAPCAHVRTLVERKKGDLDRLLGEAKVVRNRLHRILRGWASRARGGAAVCPHIESGATTPRRKVRIGEAGNLAVLQKDEWNVLVDLIQSGRLGRL